MYLFKLKIEMSFMMKMYYFQIYDILYKIVNINSFMNEDIYQYYFL
jgi:hypothetical protein